MAWSGVDALRHERLATRLPSTDPERQVDKGWLFGAVSPQRHLQAVLLFRARLLCQRSFTEHGCTNHSGYRHWSWIHKAEGELQVGLRSAEVTSSLS